MNSGRPNRPASLPNARDDEDRYFDLVSLSAYSSLSVRSLRLCYDKSQVNFAGSFYPLSFLTMSDHISHLRSLNRLRRARRSMAPLTSVAEVRAFLEE